MASDVDAVRRALGYEEITVWGGSFGSHWGMAVMRYHPEIVARAVLTGMEGPNHTYDSPTGVLNVYERVAADAEDAASFAPHVPDGGLMAAHRETIRRLERERALLDDPAREMVVEQNWFYRAACPAWDADLGDDFRKNFDTEIPTVIVHGDWDTSTPLENALELAPHFLNGKLIVVERGSHGALGEAMEEFPEFRKALYRFAATGSMDALPDGLELPEPDWVTPEDLEAEESGGG